MYEEIISKEDRADIDLLHAFFKRHGDKKDGQDEDVLEGVQKLQKIIMCRAGGTAYLLAKKNENEKSANGTGDETNGSDSRSNQQLHAAP